jgi:hypothetical protein
VRVERYDAREFVPSRKSGLSASLFKFTPVCGELLILLKINNSPQIGFTGATSSRYTFPGGIQNTPNLKFFSEI